MIYNIYKEVSLHPSLFGEVEENANNDDYNDNDEAVGSDENDDMK